jgi:predicted RNA-binding protein (virulence factor B family)
VNFFEKYILMENKLIRIGEFNELQVERQVEFGFYLTDGKNEVLLPTKYVPKDIKLGDRIEVFVYTDSEDRPIATTLKPKAAVGEFALFDVVDVTSIGAFLDWGLEKDLFVPFKAQKTKHKKGDRVVAKVVLDERTNRVMGITKISAVLDEYITDLKEGDEVDVIIYDETDLGYNLIVNNKYPGLLYKNDVFDKVKIGDRLKAYVKKFRDDEKMDITLRKPGYSEIIDTIPKILEMLENNGGFLPYNSKSSPEDINRVFKMSKKVFKQAIGGLYKQRKIMIEEDGIRLNKG